MPNRIDDEIRCSFCGKTQDEVTRLVEGPGVYICDNCIDFCASLLFEARSFQIYSSSAASPIGAVGAPAGQSAWSSLPGRPSSGYSDGNVSTLLH